LSRCGLNTQWASTTAQRAFFLVDKEGIIRARWHGTVTDVFPTGPILEAARAVTAGRSGRTPYGAGWSGRASWPSGPRGPLGSPAFGDSSSPPAVGPLAPAQLARLDLHPYPRGTPPPEFSLRTLEGRTVSLAGLRGQVALLNFWATWCLECRRELPALEALHRRFGARGLAVVGVNTREGPLVVRHYVRKLRLTFPLLLDSEGTATGRYGVIGLPTTFLIGRNGQAVALAVGPREWASAAAVEIVETLLAATSGEPSRPGGHP
jgi:cytochrome c biogenesis protein CcmG/thiol:disulfide interchange protein DsbE